MDAILVVVDGTERTEHALRAAVDRAEREGAALFAVNVTPERDYRARQDAFAGMSDLAHDGYGWTIRQAEASARSAVERQVALAVGDRDVDWTAVGSVGKPAETVLAVAADHDCVEILVAAAKPRWFGLRPGLDRTLAKRFEGTVTPVSEPAVEGSEPVPSVPEPEV